MTNSEMCMIIITILSNNAIYVFASTVNYVIFILNN